jgi:hypothetical protein
MCVLPVDDTHNIIYVVEEDIVTLVDGELESGGKTGKDSQLLVTGELPSPIVLAVAC